MVGLADPAKYPTETTVGLAAPETEVIYKTETVGLAEPALAPEPVMVGLADPALATQEIYSYVGEARQAYAPPAVPENYTVSATTAYADANVAVNETALLEEFSVGLADPAYYTQPM